MTDLATLLNGLPDSALVPVGWLRAQLETPDVPTTDDQLDMTAAEVASALGRSPATVRQWAGRGDLPGAYRLNGREWRIPRRALTAYLARQSGAATKGTTPPEGPVDLAAWRRERRAHK